MKAFLTKAHFLNCWLLLTLLLLPAFSFAQGLINNGTNIIFNGNGSSNVFVTLNGSTANYLNQSTGLITGTNISYDVLADGSTTTSLIVGGNWTNNASNAAIAGYGLTVIFNNTSVAQTIGGTASTSFFNLICSGSNKAFSAPSSLYAVNTFQNFSLSSTVTYANISSINIGKVFSGTASLNSGSIPVIIGDDYTNSATGYTVTGDWTYNGSGFNNPNTSTGTTASALTVGALNYKNLNILSADGTNKTASVNGATTVSGVLTVADKCTLQANGNLTLLSTVNGTASVAALTGSANIGGNVNVQRFTTGSYGRSYRLISSAVNNSTGFYTIASLINYTPVTGPNPGNNSFDASNTNNSSVWMYREGDPFPANTVIKDSDYKGIYSLSENIPVGTGLLFFNRGNRTTNLTTKLRGPTFPVPEDNAIAFTGVLNQGSISIKVPQNNINNFTVSSPYAKESPGSSVQSAYYYRYNSSYAPVATMLRTNWYATSGKLVDQNSDGFNLIGNPYAATVDLDLVTFGSDINSYVYSYNPSSKQFSYYSKGSATSGSSISDGNGANRYIASGQGFFVRCNPNANANNIGVTFNESNKVNTQLTASTSPKLLMSARIKGDFGAGEIIMGAPISNNLDPLAGINSKIMLELRTDTINYDGIGLFFNKNNIANYDQNDATDLDGMTPAVYLSSYSADNRRLGINQMPLANKQMRIKLYVDATTNANQQLRITDMANIAPKFNVYVVDHYKKDSLQLSLNNAYNFNITPADTSSKGANRMELVFNLNPEGVYKLLTFTGKISNRNVTLNWTTKNEANYTSFTIEKSLDGGKTFVAIGSVAANSSGSYTVTDNNLDNGVVTYRLKQNVLDVQSYSDNVSVSLNTLNADLFYVYPNPASSFIQINATKALKGAAEIRIISLTGSSILKSAAANSSALRMDISSLKPGVYIAEVTDADKKVIGRAKFVKY